MRPIILASLAVLLGGCGTGYYDTLNKQTSTQLDLASRFSVLFPGSTQVPDQPLALRIPKIFDHVYNRSSNYTNDANGVIDPERLNPPFMNPFPGALLATYEAFAKPANGDGLPVYLYMAVKAGLSPEGKTAFLQELAGKLKQLSPAADWEDVQVDDPKGQKIAWKRIKASFPQDFFPQGHGRDAAKKMPGQFEIWWYDAGDGGLMLAWRSPDDAASVNNFHSLAELTAGTIHIEDKKPEAPADPEAAARAKVSAGEQ